MPILATWLPWALLSAVFAALTAIFAKIGLEGIDSDYATLIRTFVIVLTLGALVYATGKWRSPWEIPARSGTFLILSALATGASWICYFRALKLGEASRVAPVDKLSVVLGPCLPCSSLASGRTDGSGSASRWSAPACCSSACTARQSAGRRRPGAPRRSLGPG
jgi:bacterial/archaeal transporter family protein